MNKLIKKYRKILALSASVFLIPATSLVIATKCTSENNSDKNQDKESKSMLLNDQYFESIDAFFSKNITYSVFDPWTSKETEVTKTFWEFYKAVDATISHVIDGDTVKVTFESIEKANEQAGKSNAFSTQELNIRIPFIDTPEAYVITEFVLAENRKQEEKPQAEIDQIFKNLENEIAQAKSSGDNNTAQQKTAKLNDLRNKLEINRVERSLSHFDTEYARKLLPVGKKVKLISDNWADKSYERSVAHILFQDETTNQWKLFSLEMLKNGYTLPRLTNTEVSNYKKQTELDSEQENSDSFGALVMPYIVNAFNYGIKQQKGFYSQEVFESIKSKYPNSISSRISTPLELSKFYGEHGNIYSDSKDFLMLPDESEFRSLKTNSNFYKINGIFKISQIKFS
ncbi:hypothetical protein [Mycoplasmopsis glycophila]|uniref:Lipoprotein n=1 Tax=Mycoplasmopsis glycophila TaxID=171285 RepID=A0A449AUJ5_9BACT|nr:hypothetical protein [Mycoplasmopsis glycophila]VEU70158.1 Uncharacterised protein [Mycoplasmopsis glycophila]